MNINRVIPGLIIAVACCGTALAQTGNTSYGTNALISNTTGSDNSAFGENALQLNTTGYDNTASGFYALFGNATGDNNTANGSQALVSNSTGSNNTASGYTALLLNSTGSYNTASGSLALKSNTTGNDNTASGYAALLNNQIGNYNTASGYFALLSNTTGSYNTASGYGALISNFTGNYNVASGYDALSQNGGSNNIGIGYQAGYFAATGSNNIEIGTPGHTADNNVIRIGKQGTQKFTAIAGISGVNVTGGAQVLVNSKGRLGVASSSIRYKENVNSMGDASDKVLALRPVTFQYKDAEEDGSKPVQYGLIAEEVEKVMPDLVMYNEQGQPDTVAYQALAPLLLNELQKAEKKMDRMQAEIDELRKAH